MKTAFDSEKYFLLQKSAIEERLRKFSGGKLYLEIGGKLLYDGHAERVLPGFDPRVKVKILREFQNSIEVLFCVNGNDLKFDRPLKTDYVSYQTHVFGLLQDYESVLHIKPTVVITLLDRTSIDDRVKNFINLAQIKGFKIYRKYKIEGYPENIDMIISSKGYGFDEYAETSRPLIIVTGPASNSGKLSTCLSQIYQDSKKNINSGYAKYELFPIWDLPLEHPVNLAYEAATADIGDYNEWDEAHFQNYGIRSVNYNRDIEAFKILQNLAIKFAKRNNYMNKYKSPTDMGINNASKAIIDDKEISYAAVREIAKRLDDYEKLLEMGRGQIAWVQRCKKVLIRALQNFRY